MRIAHVNQDPGISPSRKKGAAVHLDAMRRAFADLGAQVLPVDAADSRGVRAALDTALEVGPVDMIYERYALGSGAAFEVAHAVGARFVLEVNAPLEEEAQRYRSDSNSAPGTDPDLRRRMFEQADTVLAVSSAVADYAARNGASEDNLRIQPNGVDLERFRPRGEDDELRRSLVPAGRFVLGFHGRMRPWHNVPMLVEAAAELIDNGVDLHLLLVGEGDFDELLEGRVDPGRVTLAPWVAHEDVGRYVACFDALVLTHSAQAPFYFSPLKLQEAMAAGVPVVVPRLGDLPELLDDGRNALLFAPDDLRGLVELLGGLVGDEALRERLARNGCELASGCSWTGIARGLLNDLAGSRS